MRLPAAIAKIEARAFTRRTYALAGLTDDQYASIVAQLRALPRSLVLWVEFNSETVDPRVFVDGTRAVLTRPWPTNEDYDAL